MSDLSSNFALPYLAAAQAQKHVTVNQTVSRLDALTQLSVISAVIAMQPGGPTDGSVYILPPGKTGAAWDGMSNYALAYYVDGAWSQITPKTGWRAYIADTGVLAVYTGAVWADIQADVARLSAAQSWSAA
jgi:hypothetical protein